MEQDITNNNVRLSEEETFAIKGDIAAGYYDGSAHERVVARVERILAARSAPRRRPEPEGVRLSEEETRLINDVLADEIGSAILPRALCRAVERILADRLAAREQQVRAETAERIAVAIEADNSTFANQSDAGVQYRTGRGVQRKRDAALARAEGEAGEGERRG